MGVYVSYDVTANDENWMFLRILCCPFRALVVVAVLAIALTTTLKVIQAVQGCLYYREVCELK